MRNPGKLSSFGLLAAMSIAVAACSPSNKSSMSANPDASPPESAPEGAKPAEAEADAAQANADPQQDPYQWLEDVSGERSLNWVRQQNQKSQEKLVNAPGFQTLERDILNILDSDDKIPFVGKMGRYYYNFWRDAQHPRGIWRRTTFSQYKKDKPKWETILDIDELNKKESTNWVWHGARCLRPKYERCLIALSRGGADADVTREFDLKRKSFVEGGFERPESKGGLAWVDKDHVFVTTDFGEGSLTDSGYPRVVKIWKRGTPIEQAEVVYEGQKTDMSVSAWKDQTPGYKREFVSRSLAFYNQELFLRDKNGELKQVPAPNSARKQVFRDWLLLELREAMTHEGSTYPAGSLIATRFDDFMAGKGKFQSLFTPTENSSLAGFSFTRNKLVLNVLEDVKNRLYVLTPNKKRPWKQSSLKGAPDIGTVRVWPIDNRTSDDFFMVSTGYLTPSTLYHGKIGKTPRAVKQMPAFFDTAGLQVTQHFATSKDGTKVPYFMVASKDLQLNGQNPTLQYGYGGFEISLTPGYRPGVGRGWLSQGGVYVVANIRGGGEYGPRWHQAALKENRLRAYEDFAAVSQDLINRKVTSPEHLGIQGGSNGGLLVGNMTVLYPELYAATVCQVPLLDMKRYNKLLAGASWMAEYGNPDTDDWSFIREFSPYHNVKEGVKYPSVLFMTSTRDDRVHPGHARKMMAKMAAQGHNVDYYENIEGGHGGAADNKQSAHMSALAFTFLREKLMKKTAQASAAQLQK